MTIKDSPIFEEIARHIRLCAWCDAMLAFAARRNDTGLEREALRCLAEHVETERSARRLRARAKHEPR